jgi:hypothetical protein
MRTQTRLFLILATLAAVLVAVSFTQAQPGPGGKKGDKKGGKKDVEGVEEFVKRMMAFDKNKDGKLTRDEITDKRLLRLFDRADTNKDGVVTK